MAEPLDDHVVGVLGSGSLAAANGDAAADPALLWRPVRGAGCSHLDLAQRWLRSPGQGFYTIGSAGHESNAAVAMALRPSDPALLHYRSGGLLCPGRAGPRLRPGPDVLNGVPRPWTTRSRAGGTRSSATAGWA